MNFIDPVCGMTVTEKSEHHLLHKNKDYYFCSAGCQNKFHNDPEKYLNPKAEDSSNCPDGDCSLSSETTTCPMHPEIEQKGPGILPEMWYGTGAKSITGGAQPEWNTPVRCIRKYRAAESGQLSKMRHGAGSENHHS